MLSNSSSLHYTALLRSQPNCSSPFLKGAEEWMCPLLTEEEKRQNDESVRKKKSETDEHKEREGGNSDVHLGSLSTSVGDCWMYHVHLMLSHAVERQPPTDAGQKVLLFTAMFPLSCPPFVLPSCTGSQAPSCFGRGQRRVAGLSVMAKGEEGRVCL